MANATPWNTNDVYEQLKAKVEYDKEYGFRIQAESCLVDTHLDVEGDDDGIYIQCTMCDGYNKRWSSTNYTSADVAYGCFKTRWTTKHRLQHPPPPIAPTNTGAGGSDGGAPGGAPGGRRGGGHGGGRGGGRGGGGGGGGGGYDGLCGVNVFGVPNSAQVLDLSALTHLFTGPQPKSHQDVFQKDDVVELSRCHQKRTDTDAHPQNTNRDIFFSHIGWLLTRKHPKIEEMDSKLHTSDLLDDPLLVSQKKYCLKLVAIFCFLLPTVIPVYFWKEKKLVASDTAALFRYCMTLRITWLINSVAHALGYRPYDVNISPRESIWPTITASGEGGHNHHPQDYRTSEMPLTFNTSKAFIDGFARIGSANDLKTVPKEIVERQMAKQVEILEAEGKHE